MKEGNTFSKQERLCGNKQVDRLFAQGNRQIAAFPVRLVWLEVDDTRGIRLLISAPKRNFHHAVDRNRIKRQILSAKKYGKKSIDGDLLTNEKALGGIKEFVINDYQKSKRK